MSGEVIVAVLSLFGTLIGSVFSNRLTIYRIDQLEKKVNAHNNLVERTYKLEESEQIVFEKLKSINHRINELKGEIL